MENELPDRKGDAPARPQGDAEWNAALHCKYCAAPVPPGETECRDCRRTPNTSGLRLLVNWAIFIGGLALLIGAGALFSSAP